jgi:hypothetical protein
MKHSICKPIKLDQDSLDGGVVRLSETIAVTIRGTNDRDIACTEGSDE